MRIAVGLLVLITTGCSPPVEEDLPDGGSTSPPPDASLESPADASPAPSTFTRYPTTGVRSPLTPSVAERLRAIAARDLTRDPRVFMKIGASGTVSTRLLHCFGGAATYRLELGGHADLMPTVDWFRAGDAMGVSPFVRVTKAAESGQNAGWAIAGDPSPIDEEIADLNPRFAVVNYGTNDMGAGGTFDQALTLFHANMSVLLDDLENAGIVPLVSGLNPRADYASYAHWVPTFDAVTRAMAEERQLPYLSMWAASSPLPGLGLISDGVHGNVLFEEGVAQPCVLDAAGLAFNYNVRNLETLGLLDVARRAVVDGEDGVPGAVPPIVGAGTHEDPYVIDRLPFFHVADTLAGQSRFSGYPACDLGQDESGPEIVYALALPQATPLRIAVLDRGAIDVDPHLLAGDRAGDCVARHDRVISTLAPAGEGRIVVDSFVSGGQVRGGRYLLVVLACEADDPACATP